MDAEAKKKSSTPYLFVKYGLEDFSLLRYEYLS